MWRSRPSPPRASSMTRRSAVVTFGSASRRRSRRSSAGWRRCAAFHGLNRLGSLFDPVCLACAACARSSVLRSRGWSSPRWWSSAPCWWWPGTSSARRCARWRARSRKPPRRSPPMTPRHCQTFPGSRARPAAARFPASTSTPHSGVPGWSSSAATRCCWPSSSGGLCTRPWARPKATSWRWSCPRYGGRSELWLELASRRHGHVAVEARTVLDRKSADLDVAVEAACPCEGQAALGGDVAGHGAAHADVGALDRGLDRRRRVDRDVAARLQVAFDGARDLQVALDLQAPLQGVARAKADDVGAAVLSPGCLGGGLFCLSHGNLHNEMRSIGFSGS